MQLWKKYKFGPKKILQQFRGSKGTVLCGEYWLWAWHIYGGLQTCIARRSKVPNG